MGHYAFYKAIFDAVAAALGGVGAIAQVIYNERFQEPTLPCAVINPGKNRLDLDSTAASFDEYGGTIQGNITVLVLDEEPGDWFADVIAVLSDVVDALLADRSIGDTVLDILSTDFTPGEVHIINRVYYGGTVDFAVLVEYKP